MAALLTNPASLFAQRAADGMRARLDTAVARLSSGLRVNSARDDVAGQAIISRLGARLGSLSQAQRNTADGIGALQVAEAGLQVLTDNLQRVRELAVQAVNGTLSDEDRRMLQAEVNQLMLNSSQIQRDTEFNGRTLLDGSFSSQSFQVGADAGNLLAISIPRVFNTQISNEAFTYVQLTQADASGTPLGAISAGDLRINSVSIGASSAGSAAGQSAGSAWAVARAINAASGTRVTASAGPTTTAGSYVTAGLLTVGAGALTVNGVAVGAGNAVNEINQIATQTGVTASTDIGSTTVLVAGVPTVVATTSIVLSAADGRDIVIGGSGAGLSAGTSTGEVHLSSTVAIRTYANIVIGGNDPAQAGFSAGTIVASNVGDPVLVPLDEESGYDQNVDVSTADFATSSLSFIDTKLNRANQARAAIGAQQARMEAIVNALSSQHLNAAASLSRIRDTDYAAETAMLARQRILQQASTAMQVQANSQPRQVLALLRALRS